MKDEQKDMEAYPDEEDMEYMILEDEIESTWRMVLLDNNGGLDYAKSILHANRWDVYMKEK